MVGETLPIAALGPMAVALPWFAIFAARAPIAGAPTLVIHHPVSEKKRVRL